MSFLKTILQEKENLIALKNHTEKLIDALDTIIMLNSATLTVEWLNSTDSSETKTLPDLILNIIENENCFLSNRDILNIITTEQIDEVFDFEINTRTISVALSKLQNNYSIYLYKHKGVRNMSLWGRWYWLDKNRLPKEKYIRDSVWKQRIANYKKINKLK